MALTSTDFLWEQVVGWEDSFKFDLFPRTAKLVGEITGDMVHRALDIMESRNPELFAAGKEIANKISFNIKVSGKLIY